MCPCLGKACPGPRGGGHPKILISISATNPTYICHGQLYVAISQVTSSANIKIFNGLGPDGYMQNVIYREVLEM
jgi:hypothetical protein